MKLQQIKNTLKRRAEKGVTMIEYALIAALVAIAAVTILGTVGNDLTNIFTKVSANLQK